MIAGVPAERLDLWLSQDRGLTRSGARALIDAGAVTVNGRRGRPGQRVDSTADVLVAAVAPALVETGSGPPVSLTVIFEDEWLAVIDKPAGLVVHPAPGHPHGTLADGLRQRGSTWSVAAGVERPGIVHRLDKDTSGLLVVAKGEAAHRKLAAQFQHRTAGRVYWALVQGGVSEQTGRIDAPLGRHPHHRQRMAVVTGGRVAVTDFSVVERCPGATLLDVTLRTGRTHQIRAHLAFIGRPVIGDPIYGQDGSAGGRVALHARRLAFDHPADGSRRTFESPIPTDLADLLTRLRVGER